MKKFIYPPLLSIFVAVSWLLTPSSLAYDHYYPTHIDQLHPQHPDYYNGNQRLKLKKRADIERASSSNLHYDQYARDYYRCDWNYNKNLGTWVCDKDYGRFTPPAENHAQPTIACPYGTTFHSSRHECIPVLLPANAHLNPQGDQWQCNAGYIINSARTGCDRKEVYYADNSVATNPSHQYVQTQYVTIYDDQEREIAPQKLPGTGLGFGWLIISSFGGMATFVLKKIK